MVNVFLLLDVGIAHFDSKFYKYWIDFLLKEKELFLHNTKWP
jgi:hypothetical protein